MRHDWAPQISDDRVPGGNRARITQADAICSFDHAQLAGLRSYGRLQEALDNLISEARKKEITMPVVDWLVAMEDMVLTSEFADCCRECCDDQANPHVVRCFPHRVRREGDYLTCTYRCTRCEHVWSCDYAVSIVQYKWW
jgi:hypothetical protein